MRKGAMLSEDWLGCGVRIMAAAGTVKLSGCSDAPVALTGLLLVTCPGGFGELSRLV